MKKIEIIERRSKRLTLSKWNKIPKNKKFSDNRERKYMIVGAKAMRVHIVQ